MSHKFKYLIPKKIKILLSYIVRKHFNDVNPSGVSTSICDPKNTAVQIYLV